MDPSRNDFNGSGLPHHGRQGHGQDQGQQQQLSGFPFQFQNRLAALSGGIERRRELRELQDQILLRQELERRQRALTEQQELMSQIVEGKYTQLTRQGNDPTFHRQQVLNNLQSPRGHVFLNPEDRLRFQRVAAQQQQQQQEQRQKAQAAVQQALLQQQEIQHRRELQQHQNLQELQKRKFQELLLSRIGGNTVLARNESFNESLEDMLHKRNQSLSGDNNSAISKILELQRKRSEEMEAKMEANSRINDDERFMQSDEFQISVKEMSESTNTGMVQESSMKMPGNHDRCDSSMEVIEKEHLQLAENQSNLEEVKKNELIEESSPSEKEESPRKRGRKRSPSKSKKASPSKSPKISPAKTITTSEANATIDTLIQAAQHTDASNDDHSDGGENNTEDNDGEPNMTMIFDVVKKIFTDDEAAELMYQLKEITNQDPTAAAYFGIPDLEQLEISPGHFTIVPKLPEEPNFDESEMKRKIEEQMTQNNVEKAPKSNRPEDVRRDVGGPIILDNTSNDPLRYKFSDIPTQSVDSWFPNSISIRRERRMDGVTNDEKEVKLGTTSSETIVISEEMSKRLRSDYEPGIMEKLPHCNCYNKAYMEQYGKLPKEPLFCFQVTEAYCNSAMVCCSVCGTWRHAECGGHHRHYSPKSTNEYFTPICDRCHEEKEIIDHFPTAEKRLARQRSIQLRTVHAITAIMRNSAYAKHGGTYKWPLGSVSHFHIGSHTKSIHLRQERSEKQWKEMSAKLNARNNTKSNKAKIRTRDFERLMVNLEDAEGQTDRHNMTLFLEWDTARENPVGFERPSLNFFDPAEDEQRSRFNFNTVGEDHMDDKDDDNDDDDDKDDDDDDSSQKQNGDNHKSNNYNKQHDSKGKDKSGDTTQDQILSGEKNNTNIYDNNNNGNNLNETNIAAFTGKEENKGHIRARTTRVRHSPKRNNLECLNEGCMKKPRFDSSFCSDACGIATMERDLLKSLRYAAEMHPYQLRP